MIGDGILHAETSHTRHVEVSRSFTYSHFMFALDLLNLKQYEALNPLLGVNKSALYRFDFADHCILKEQGLDGLSESTFENFGHHIQDYSKVILVTNLRSLGYIFNPISVYLCFLKDRSDRFDIIYEVGNTFGEQKYYYSTETSKVHQKNFYVSPFIEHKHNFKFHLNLDDKQLSLSVTTQTEQETPILTANLRGHLQALNSNTIKQVFLKHPLVNFKIILLIHLQAFFLYLKKLRYFKKEEFMENQTNYQRLDS